MASESDCSKVDSCERLDMTADADAGLRLLDRTGEAAGDDGSGAECELLIAEVSYEMGRSIDGGRPAAGSGDKPLRDRSS